MIASETSPLEAPYTHASWFSRLFMIWYIPPFLHLKASDVSLETTFACPPSYDIEVYTDKLKTEWD
jgi:hypothetical protein